MKPIRLDGIETARALKGELAARVDDLAAHGITPGLGTILVGENPASTAYVNGKHRDCAEIGVESVRVQLPETAGESDILAAVQDMNANPDVTGYIVQLPLPQRVRERAVLEAIAVGKDADGLHPTNLGYLVSDGGRGSASTLPCTPAGIVELLERYAVPIAGEHVVVIGRGLTVGRPLSLLLTARGYDATVTVAHSKTPDIARHTREAGIVVAAVGVPGLVQPDWVREGAAVVDVGATQVGVTASGKRRLAGDVSPEVAKVAGYLTPNPGGVGPMTRAMLLANVVKTAEAQRKKKVPTHA